MRRRIAALKVISPERHQGTFPIHIQTLHIFLFTNRAVIRLDQDSATNIRVIFPECAEEGVRSNIVADKYGRTDVVEQRNRVLDKRKMRKLEPVVVHRSDVLVRKLAVLERDTGLRANAPVYPDLVDRPRHGERSYVSTGIEDIYGVAGFCEYLCPALTTIRCTREYLRRHSGARYHDYGNRLVESERQKVLHGHMTLRPPGHLPDCRPTHRRSVTATRQPLGLYDLDSFRIPTVFKRKVLLQNPSFWRLSHSWRRPKHRQENCCTTSSNHLFHFDSPSGCERPFE